MWCNYLVAIRHSGRGVAMERWRPRESYTRQEQFILKCVEKKRRLFGFLRRHRSEIFDDGFQTELESMYRDTGAGKEPKPPAFMAMVLLLQGVLGTSDGDAVEVAMLDLRWQMVLDCLGATEPAFSQGNAASVSRSAHRARHGSPAAGALRGAGTSDQGV